MSRKLFFWTLPLIFVMVSWTNTKTTSFEDEIAVANDLISMVNNHRVKLGKSKLIRSEAADALAAQHASYMSLLNDVNHDNFDARWDALEQTVNAEEITENIGYDSSAEKAMRVCLENLWSKANIEGDFTHIGLAVKKDDNGNYYYTQIFYK